MKKNSLLKVIAIVFGIYVVLTWFIPTGYFSSGEFVKSDITPVGLFDIVRYPLITLTSSVFILTSLVILLIGGLYGVLNKTGVYQKFVDGVVKHYKDKGTIFVVISILLFTVLSSLTALSLPLLILVPFFSTVILLLGYNKIVAMLSTIGAILIGNVASTYGFNVAGYITYFTNDINDSIIYRVLLFIALVGLMIFTVLKISKEKETVKKDEILLYEKLDSKVKVEKKPTAMIIVIALAIIVTLVGMFNWEEVFGITFFEDMYTKITDFKIGSYPLFANLIGAMYQMGSWTNYELSLVIVITALLLGWIYKLKFSEIAQSFIEGAKKLLPVAIYAIIANVIFLMMNASSTGYTIFPTIVNWLFGLVDGFNVIIFGLVSLIGGVLYNDFPYLLGAIYDPVTNLYSDSIPVMGMIVQTFHGIIQFILPTSVLLVVGLKYFGIAYMEWLKKVYKFVLLALLIIAIIIAIMALI